MCRLFMDPLDDPFASAEVALDGHRLGDGVAAIVVDVHGEATSEKQAFGHVLDGRVSVVAGTHTHVPTADARILAGGTGFQTDLGMTGDYDSVIGMKKDNACARFITKLPQGRLEPAEGEASLCGVFVVTNDSTGLTHRIEPLRIGGGLAAQVPSL